MAETTVTSTESAGGDGRASRAARTRIAVVDALLALNEKGNLRPTAREIAAEAGVSLRSIYVHFDDVESLLVAAAVRHGEYLISLARPVPTEGPLARRVAALVANRRTLYEAGTGVRRAALAQEPFSPALQRALEAGRKAARAEIDNVFAAEIAAADMHGARLRQALTLALGSPSWDVMRRYQKLTADEAEEQLRTMVLALLEGVGRRLGGGIERAQRITGYLTRSAMTSAAVDSTTKSTARRPELSEVARRLAFLAPLVALVVLQRVVFPAPLGVVVNGALFGSRIALIALGIALIYRANRIINFAQGDLGAVPATLAVMLVVAWNWNYWIGLIAGLAAALVLGVLVETLIIRRFFSAPRLVLTVATIGLAQLLAGAGLFLPRAFGNQSFGTRLAPPFEANFEIGGTNFNANDVLTMIVVPICLVTMALFLQRSRVGVAILGSAERADRAFTLGIPVKRLHTVVWVVASVLAFLGMFLRAGAVGLPIGEVLPPTFLVQALAAAVFGRFERFTTIAAAAIGLGIVDQAMTFQPGNRPAYNDAVLFGIVLAGLLLTRRSRTTSRVDNDASATWQATREIRPIPRELRRLPEVVGARALLAVGLGLFVLTLPAWLSTSRINLATIILIFGIVAASLVVLTGWAGQVSLGQMAFVGIGAAVGGALTDHRGWDLALAGALAGLVGAVAAVVVGYPALRRGGLTLAVSTLAFGLFVSQYVLNRTIFPDWLPGRRIDRGTILGIELTGETAMFYASLAVLALALVMVVGLRRSRTGRVLIAIRENERAARVVRVNATRTQLAAFAFSGFLAAVAGSLYVHQQTGLSIDPYLPQRSLELFTMVVIGGLGSLPGALLGATYVFSVDFFLPNEWQFLATGVGLLLVLLIFPSGLGGVLADVRDAALRRVAKRRHLVVPSLVADVRVDEADMRLETVDEPPVEEVLLAAGEMAEQAEQAEMAEDARQAEEVEAATPGAAEPEAAAAAVTPSGGDGFRQEEPEDMGSASGTHDLAPGSAEPIASGSERVEGRS